MTKPADVVSGTLGSAVIAIETMERRTRISKMESDAYLLKMAVLNKKNSYVIDEGSTKLDGIEKLRETFEDLYKTVDMLGDLVIKDAGILNTIADDFEKADNSVNATSKTGGAAGVWPTIIQNVAKTTAAVFATGEKT